MKALPFLSLAVLAVAIGCKGGGEAVNTAPAAAPVAYSKVQDVLNSHCAGCHGAGNPKGGVDLTGYEAVMKGGQDGPIVKAGDPATSELVLVMRGAPGHKKMPPRGDAVPEADIKTIEAWVQSGAKS